MYIEILKWATKKYVMYIPKVAKFIYQHYYRSKFVLGSSVFLIPTLDSYWEDKMWEWQHVYDISIIESSLQLKFGQYLKYIQR